MRVLLCAIGKMENKYRMIKKKSLPLHISLHKKKGRILVSCLFI